MKRAWLSFKEQPPKPKRVTKTWIVYAARDKVALDPYSTVSPLGRVHWATAWRRYVFEPEAAQIIFDTACLREIADFCEARQEGRKA